MRRDPHPDPLRFRRRVLLGVWLIAGAAVVARAGQVQIVQGAQWQDAATRQQQTVVRIPAPRGSILDREGVPLVETRVRYEVAVDGRIIPEEDRGAVADSLVAVLGISRREARRAVNAHAWKVLGRFPPEAYARLRDQRGVFLEILLSRAYPQGRMALGILGRVDGEHGVGGVEQAFDDVLRGEAGEAVRGRDPSSGRPTSQVFQRRPAQNGGSVRLTLDADLQAIAKEALAHAVESSEATGGDLLITDPATGAILAAVSLKNGVDLGLSFMTEPVEPGSTMKPFTLAALLERGRGSLDDEYDVGDGRLEICGRELRDVGGEGVMTLERAVQVSSNVAVAQAAEALAPEEHWEVLRDFGFGEITGLPIAVESGGRLRRPHEWTCQSRASHAIGYEMAATPLQVAMAYGALANGGTLMEPRLLQEVRTARGEVTTVKPRVVRRAVSRRVAETVTDVLVGVVEDGTGTAAQLLSFTVAGKSGTARAHVDGSYERGRYFSSFVGYFPAEDPKLVIYAKLDEVDQYGGAVAAPVTRATLEAALAASGTLSRAVGLPVSSPEPAPGTDSPFRFAGDVQPLPTPPVEDRTELRTAWASGRERLDFELPDMDGFSVRQAAARLHAMGLRVSVEGAGPVSATVPRAGALVSTGDTIRLRSRRSGP